MFQLFTSRWFERFCLLSVAIGFYAYSNHLENNSLTIHTATEYENLNRINESCGMFINDEAAVTDTSVVAKKIDRRKAVDSTKDDSVKNIGKPTDVEHFSAERKTDEVVNIGEYRDVNEVRLSSKSRAIIDIGPPLDVDKTR